MTRLAEPWDYLIVTASNPAQAAAYESQLAVRRELGLLGRAREVLVVADPEGRRAGSGGSAVYCLSLLVARERARRGLPAEEAASVEELLRGTRTLIVHAGGDSRRLPAYGPCGKIFVPVPGESNSAAALTLFDRLVPVLLDLPAGTAGAGQTVIAAGDALLRFDPAVVNFARQGITMLGGRATPEEAARHGVFCTSREDAVRLYLQKPPAAEQVRLGAVDRHGRSALDIGIVSLDGAAGAALLAAFGFAADGSWDPGAKEGVLERGVDLYREICCAMGTEATLEHYVRTARASGSAWTPEQLAPLFPCLQRIPFQAQVLGECTFLHFGSTRQLIASGLALAAFSDGVLPERGVLQLNNAMRASGAIEGRDAWVEGCRVEARVRLAGQNVVSGVDVSEPLDVPCGACLDVIPGRDRAGEAVRFVRWYGIEDTFKQRAGSGATFCNVPVEDWLAAAGAKAPDVWDADLQPGERTLWNARVFPSDAADGAATGRWRWMFEPAKATPEERAAFLAADRYSAAEIALLTDQEAFYRRRARIRADVIRDSLAGLFGERSSLSADDLAFALRHTPARGETAAAVVELARCNAGGDAAGLESLAVCRIVHTLAAAVLKLEGGSGASLGQVLPGFANALAPEARAWIDGIGAVTEDGAFAAAWAEGLRRAAFGHLHATIVESGPGSGTRPRNALRKDETIWGRAPARIELGGGWTDTPPYSLERGGDVTNAAVNLNGQPPIHCYCRILEEPVVRLNSIDGGGRLEIAELGPLLDYKRPGDEFALAKAALAISGFAPGGGWRDGATLREMLLEFGGGIELTTLAGIPKGSGLGTSSILGAVIAGVIRRLTGRELNRREIFHDVLRLEQALTTGGGWQDQIGGGTGGVKLTTTRPGMFPDPEIHYVPADLLDPRLNGGTTLLYYTGMTRLAKNILEQVVGGYLNRDRAVMEALAEEHRVAHAIADAMGRRDAPAFGRYLNAAWELQKRLCGSVTNESIERLLVRVRPFVYGMRISGAGSGGFLLMIARTAADAERIRETLEREPLNDRSRFFDFDINHAGLEVTTC